jgi:hypothetical protein
MADTQNIPPPPSGSIVAVPGAIPPPPSGSIVAVQSAGEIPPPPSGTAIPVTPAVSSKQASVPGPAYGSDDWYEQKLGELVPQSAVPALSFINKYLIQPFNQLAEKGTEVGKEIGSDVVSTGTLLAHPDYLQATAPSPYGPKPPVQSPESLASEEHPIAKGVAEGVGATAGGAIADPRNWPFFASGAARPILQKIISGGFGTLMGKDAITAAQDLHDNWDKYTPEQRAQLLTQSGLSAAMAGAAGLHALSGETAEARAEDVEAKPVSEIPPPPSGVAVSVGEASPVARTTGLEPATSIADTVQKYATDESGTLDVDRLHQMASDEIKNEIQPFLEEKKASLGDMLDELQHVIAPRAGAARSTLDSVFDLAGKREQHNWTLDSALQPIRVAFDKLPEDAQVDFVDRYKAGEPQATPAMQSVDDFMRKTDADTYRAVVDTQVKNLDPKAQKLWTAMSADDKTAFLQNISSFKGDESLPAGPLKDLADGLLNFKDNHYRVLWKELPKPLTEDGEVDESAPGNSGIGGALGRRPLQGSKGFMRQSTLDSMSEGLERGGVPVDYNPVRMFELAQADSWRYITAQRMWQDALDQGARIFVKRGSRVPDGFSTIGDKIGDVSFPAKSGEGNIPAGKWAMRDDYARLLTNMLSDDRIRQSGIGNTLMNAKNLLTMYRLSLSPFHAFTTTVSGMASNLNRGITGVWDAARLGDSSLAGQGLKDILRTPISPIQDYKLGTDVVNYARNKAEFLKTMRGQDFVKAYPDADRLVNDLFAGGAKLGLHEDERVSSIANMRKVFAQDKPLAGVMRVPFALQEKMFQPLFSYYIPRLKVATWLRDYSHAIVDRADDLAAGKTTRGELARQTWDAVDNMYGQMNWDARYWNRTFKASIQAAFRAFTWFAGNVRMVKDAGIGQVRELAKSAQFIADRSAGRPTEAGATALPRIDPNFGKIASLLALTAAGNTALQIATGNGAPQDFKDLMAARIGKNKDGSPMRVTIPAIVIKDGISALYGGVGNYLKAKESDLISGILDAANNKDFRGAMIHHPEDSWWKQRYDDLRHGIGNPIGVSTALRARELGGGTVPKVLGAIGFAPAPREIDMSKGAIAARDFVRAYTNANAPEASVEKAQQTHELKVQHENGSLSAEKLGQMKGSGEITPGQAKKITAKPMSDLIRNFMSPDLPIEKALEFLPDYSPEERAELRPFLLKRGLTIDRLDRTPLQKQALKAQLRAALKGQ